MKKPTRTDILKIRGYKKTYGTQRAIYYAEGLLGVPKGRYMRQRTRIRKVVMRA